MAWPTSDERAQQPGLVAVRDPGTPLTIAIPTRDRPELFRRALRSIVGGAGRPAPPRHVAERVEIVVSDNASDSNDDRVRFIAAELLDGWPGPTRYVRHRPPVNMVANFNACLAAASGEYVLLLHDDDYLFEGGLREIVTAISGDERHDVMLFGVALVDLDGRVERRQGFRRSRVLSPAQALRHVLTDSSFVRAPAIVVRRWAYAEVGSFDDLDGPEDVDMEVRLFARFGVQCVSVTTAAYTIHSEAATSSMFNAETIPKLMTIFERARRLGVLDDGVVRRSQAAFFHQFILAGAWRAMRAGDWARAREILALFDVPAVRGLGVSLRWSPYRVAFRLFVPRRPGTLPLEH